MPEYVYFYSEFIYISDIDVLTLSDTWSEKLIYIYYLDNIPLVNLFRVLQLFFINIKEKEAHIWIIYGIYNKVIVLIIINILLGM